MLSPGGNISRLPRKRGSIHLPDLDPEPRFGWSTLVEKQATVVGRGARTETASSVRLSLWLHILVPRYSLGSIQSSDVGLPPSIKGLQSEREGDARRRGGWGRCPADGTLPRGGPQSYPPNPTHVAWPRPTGFQDGRGACLGTLACFKTAEEERQPANATSRSSNPIGDLVPRSGLSCHTLLAVTLSVEAFSRVTAFGAR